MDPKSLNQKIIHGFLTLTFRRVLLLAISFIVTNIWLAKILPPDVIGVFNIATSLLTFFAYFSDIGLAGAIIQKKELDPDDLKTTFTVQLLLVGLILITISLAAPYFAAFLWLGTSCCLANTGFSCWILF